MRVGDFIEDVKRVNDIQKILQKTHEDIAANHPVFTPDLMEHVAQNIVHFAIMYCLPPPTKGINLKKVEALKRELPKIEEDTVAFIKEQLTNKGLKERTD